MDLVFDLVNQVVSVLQSISKFVFIHLFFKVVRPFLLSCSVGIVCGVICVIAYERVILVFISGFTVNIGELQNPLVQF